MSTETTTQPRVTKIFGELDYGENSNMMPVLGVFISYSRGIGLTEEELAMQSGLNVNKALRQVALLEKEGFVRSFICQEGTAGPYARRYKLVSDVTIKLEVSRPA